MEILLHSLGALWHVAWVGLLLGAGLPALFALGMRSLGITASDGVTAAPTTPAGRVGAYVCFGLVAAAALFGIVVIVFGKQLFG